MFSLNRNGVYGGKSISLAWRDNYKYGQHISYDKSTDGKSSRSTLIDGQKIGGLIAIGAFAAVFVKFLVLITGKSLTMLLADAGSDGLTFVRLSWIWLASTFGHLMWPAVCGILVTLFSWAMIYLDSDVPGISPPSPLSSQKYRSRYRSSRQRTCHLNYMMSLASGLVVFALLYLSNNEKK